MGRFLIIALALIAVVSNIHGLPYEVKIDRATGLKFFWYASDNGTSVKAFLEGGPPVATPAAVEDETHFYLFTKANPTTAQELKPNCASCIDNSNFNPAAPIKFICHGFWSSAESDINSIMRDAFFRLPYDVNVIVVDWASLAAAPWYDTAAANTDPVGRYIASFVDYLVGEGKTSYDKIHFSGHSLGSHVGGFMGTYAQGLVDRITAMDPALPLFGVAPDSGRIDPSDAALVDVIHTAGDTLGFMEPRGHIDFYPNGGKNQPGCSLDPVDSCSHGRSYHFMAESAWHQEGFPGYKCNSWQEYNEGRCSMTEKAFMGYPVDRNARGNYYLMTKASPPYGQG